MGKNEGFSNLAKKKVHDIWLRDKIDQKQLVSLQPNMFLVMFLFLNLHNAFWLSWKTIELLSCFVWLPNKSGQHGLVMTTWFASQRSI